MDTAMKMARPASASSPHPTRTPSRSCSFRSLLNVASSIVLRRRTISSWSLETPHPPIWEERSKSVFRQRIHVAVPALGVIGLVEITNDRAIHEPYGHFAARGAEVRQRDVLLDVNAGRHSLVRPTAAIRGAA